MGTKTKIKLKSLNIAQQVAGLKALYPDAICRHDRISLTWTGEIKPTPISATYSIRIEYTIGGNPECFSCTPLSVPAGKKLPHVYSHKDQKLCLYYPKGKTGHWNASKSIAATIVPWASEWLFYYELWLSTGEWLGGGVHHTGSK